MSFIDRLFGDPFDTPQQALNWLLAPGEERRQVAIPLMATALRRAGYTVIRTLPAPVPHAGECWVPTRGEGSSKRHVLPPSRWVRSVGADEMSYAGERDGLPILIKRASWDRWVQKTRARRG